MIVRGPWPMALWLINYFEFEQVILHQEYELLKNRKKSCTSHQSFYVARKTTDHSSEIKPNIKTISRLTYEKYSYISNSLILFT